MLDVTYWHSANYVLLERACSVPRLEFVQGLKEFGRDLLQLQICIARACLFAGGMGAEELELVTLYDDILEVLVVEKRVERGLLTIWRANEFQLENVL
jgi:hypothetical protein